MTDRIAEEERRLNELENLVAAAFEADRVPETTVSRAATFLSWRSPGADIAFLEEATSELVAVRDVDAPALHRFVSDLATIELTVSADAVVGTIQPWTGGLGSTEFVGGSTPLEVDEHGSFHGQRPPVRSIRLRFEGSDAETLTGWFLIQ